MMFHELSILVLCIASAMANQPRKQYAMYVWTTGFDHTVPGCNKDKFLQWKSSDGCFTHVWDTPAKRAWLWNTCNLPGREIGAIFLSDVHRNLKHAYETGNCDTADIARVRQTLDEGHSKVVQLKIYGLYAVSDLAVSEKNLIKYIVHYNDVCARSASERFDGVAVNNEAYAKIKCGDMTARLQYLDDLQTIVVEARKQQTGTLLTHYSVSWHWGQCDDTQSIMTWNGKTSDVVYHMIDIFDSVDVQVGYIQFPQISDRLKLAGYAHAQSLGKTIYATVYTNKASPCQISFFPDDTCRIHGHTEANMFSVFDSFSSNGVEYAQPCIHYFRGIYSTGVDNDWPLHNGATSGKVDRLSPKLYLYVVFIMAWQVAYFSQLIDSH